MITQIPLYLSPIAIPHKYTEECAQAHTRALSPVGIVSFRKRQSIPSGLHPPNPQFRDGQKLFFCSST